MRVISATNRNLEKAVQEGRFREDLYYRLNVISIQMPPLRERLADLNGIATNYLQFFARQCGKRITGFSPEADKALRQYAWPGNLRELRNVIERAVILSGSDEIDRADFPEKFSRGLPTTGAQGLEVGARVSLEEVENEHIARVIRQTATVEEAAKVLGVDPATGEYQKRFEANLAQQLKSNSLRGERDLNRQLAEKYGTYRKGIAQLSAATNPKMKYRVYDLEIVPSGLELKGLLDRILELNQRAILATSERVQQITHNVTRLMWLCDLARRWASNTPDASNTR